MKFLSILLLSLILTIGVSFASDDYIENLLIEAQTASKSYKDFDAISIYVKVLELDSNNFDGLYNLSYLYNRQGGLNRNDEVKRELYYQSALKYAKKLFQLYPLTYESNLSMAGAIARISEFENAKYRVNAAWEIKKHADIAFSLNPNDPQVWFLLAWWNFEISKANWLEKSLAKVFFGGLPTNATFEKALESIKNALALSPNNIVYLHDLALFYNYKENFTMAKNILNIALEYTPKSPEDLMYIIDCQKLLNHILGN